MKPRTMLLAAAALSLCAAQLAQAAPARQPKRKTAMSADGGRIAVAAGKTKVAVLDEQGKVVSEQPLEAPAAESAFAPDGRTLAVCLERGGLLVLEEGKPARRVPEPAGECSELNWSPNGKKLYYLLTRTGTDSPNAPSDTQELKIWDASTGSLSSAHASAVERADSGFRGNVSPTPQKPIPQRPQPVPDALGRIPKRGSSQ